MRAGIFADQKIKTIDGRSVQISAGSNIYQFKEKDEWFLAILEKAMRTKFYGELRLKIENGVVVIADEVKKHKPEKSALAKNNTPSLPIINSGIGTTEPVSPFRDLLAFFLERYRV